MQGIVVRVIVVIALTILIAAISAVVALGLAEVIPPLGTVAALMFHPVGAAITYCLSAFVAFKIFTRKAGLGRSSARR